MRLRWEEYARTGVLEIEGGDCQVSSTVIFKAILRKHSEIEGQSNIVSVP
jgi:hypothetical protein